MSGGLTVNNSPYRMPSFKEAMAFWEYMYKKRLQSIILYILSFFVFLIASWWMARELLGGYFVGPYHALILAIAIAPVLFFYIPIIPKSYQFHFNDKMRRDIPEAELKALLMEMTGKSLEIAAIVIISMSMLCLTLFGVASYLAIPGVITLALVAAAAFNIFLISLVAFSLGGYNKELLRKAFTEEEYRRYTSPGGYKNIFIILVAFDALICILIVLGMSAKVSTALMAILIMAIINNAALAMGVWNFMGIRRDEERKAVLPQMRAGLALLIMVDVIFILALFAQRALNMSYEMSVLVLLTAFLLIAGILGIIRLVIYLFLERH